MRTHLFRGVVSILAAAVLGWSVALAIDDDRDPPTPPCLERARISFNASPSTVPLGQGTTLSWNVTGCPGATISLSGVGAVAATGWHALTPKASGTWILTVRYGGASKSRSVPITVTLPKDAWGRVNITITSNDQAALFVQAISSSESANAIVYIQNHVRLDLSHRYDIHIAPGVQIFGGRSAKDAGPLLSTSTYPGRLFVIGEYESADNVRISGIRLKGADESAAEEDTPDSIGIFINSSRNVQIDNNQIYGWHVAAISVKDTRERINMGNGAGSVYIHGNSLHNNQRIGEGYGIEVGAGAYALIERNTFDHNRHAIAGDGEYGSGYFFYRNLVGTGGGQHEGAFGVDYHTHQIDMHGQEDCMGADGYCGIAGQYMDVRFNSIMYTAGIGILVRGSPTTGMEVTRNAFAHTDQWGHFLVDRSAAMAQSDSVAGYGEIEHWDNRFGTQTHERAAVCDFNGDGLKDTFRSHGATWSYAASGGPAFGNGYRYLNTSTLDASALQFGDFDSDGKCDVKVAADGRISWSGTSPLERVQATDILLANPAAAQTLRLAQLANGVIVGDTYPSLSADRQVLGTGDFDGDGDADVLTSRASADMQGFDILRLQDGAVVSSFNAGYIEAGAILQGLGDFDGDGAADILWRLPDGRLRMRLRPKGPGDVGNDANPSYRNSEDPRVALDWHVAGVADFNGDRHADILWRHDGGLVAIWLMVGSTWMAEAGYWGPEDRLSWTVQGLGDFDGDGAADILWRHTDGRLAIWFKGADYTAVYPTYQNQFGAIPGPEWQVRGVSDFNHDGRSDILWRRTDGVGTVWLMKGGWYEGEPAAHFIDTSWQVRALVQR